MRLFNPVDSFDSFFSITRRQTGTDSAGLVYSNQCRGTAGNDCCLNRECSTDVGDGYCRNRDNQTCEGEYVVGSPPDYPCPGPGYIVCCVRWEDMVNGTDTSSSSTSAQTTLTSSSSSAPPSPSSSTTDGSSPAGTNSASSNSSSGLTAPQKGGIAGGIVGAVAVTSLVFFLVWWMRRRRRLLGKGEDIGDEGGDEKGDNRAVTETAAGVMRGTGSVERGHENEEDKGAAMLASREKQELDGSGRALHEMDSETAVTPTTPTGNEKGAPETKIKRMAELPGSLAAIAEMPVPEERRG
ncbi:hypothetical protein BJY00DRAFT_314097 [Aspergillus carlsbadensis]|nr:hypothetical protein BJY00DRAFT_314097 [Aspergillus carlsbadensis]